MREEQTASSNPQSLRLTAIAARLNSIHGHDIFLSRFQISVWLQIQMQMRNRNPGDPRNVVNNFHRWDELHRTRYSIEFILGGLTWECGEDCIPSVSAPCKSDIQIGTSYVCGARAGMR